MTTLRRAREARRKRELRQRSQAPCRLTKTAGCARRRDIVHGLRHRGLGHYSFCRRSHRSSLIAWPRDIGRRWRAIQVSSLRMRFRRQAQSDGLHRRAHAIVLGEGGLGLSRLSGTGLIQMRPGDQRS